MKGGHVARTIIPGVLGLESQATSSDAMEKLERAVSDYIKEDPQILSAGYDIDVRTLAQIVIIHYAEIHKISNLDTNLLGSIASTPIRVTMDGSLYRLIAYTMAEMIKRYNSTIGQRH
jgi:hypothetical protein